MCYKWPGPRCSNHAEKKLDKLKLSRESVRAELRTTYTSFKEASQEFRENPESKSAARKAKSLHRKSRTLKNKLSELNSDIRLAQRDFDGTRKGQTSLKQELASFDKENGDFNDYADLTNRLSSGKMLYSWRKNQLRLQEEEAKTGKTLKERRGKFLTLSDRLDGDVMVIDPETIDAVSRVRDSRNLVLS